MSEEYMENDTPKNEEEVQPNEQQNEELNKAKEYGNNQKTRAEKAEQEIKDLKAKLENITPKNKESETLENENKSNEPDYAKLAYLKAEGITHPDDQKMIQDEANRLKLPLTDVLQMEHMKSSLKKAGQQREAEAGMPDGSGKPASGTKNSVDYWVNKTNKDGSYAVPDDPELHDKVIEARMKGDKSSQMFDPIQ